MPRRPDDAGARTPAPGAKGDGVFRASIPRQLRGNPASPDDREEIIASGLALSDAE
jgi:hypothetical protein